MRPFTSVTRFAAPPLLIFACFFVVAAQTDSIYRLPAGTHMYLKMDAEINSGVSSVNDTFTAVVTRPVKIRDVVALPVGTMVEGRVASVSRAGSGRQDGKLVVVFETLRVSREARRNIDGVMVTEIKADSSSTGIISILGGTAAGAAVGGITKSGSGTLIGAGIGAGIGTGIALLRKGKEVRLRPSQEFEIELKKEVILPVEDY